MDAEQILQLIDAVSRSSLSEFEYEQDDTKLKLRKQSAPAYVASNPDHSRPVQNMPEGTVPIVSGNPAEAMDPISSETVITSPLVGTFYSAPSEEAEPFVQVGDAVKKGQVIGIIETMKLMNEIECETDGVISAILIENEQVVEYGQPLFRIC